MPFEAPFSSKIAVIGSGVSGLAAAWELSRAADVTVFEAAPRLGGHARTVLAGRRGDVPVDTGFIVFNYHTYPELTRMFAALDVPVRQSDMSFGVSVGDGALEYALRDMRALAAQPRNLARPRFWRMLADVAKFNREAVRLAQNPDMTLKQLLDRMHLGDWFRNYYLYPMSGAIWSSTPEQIEGFPARALVQFFHNHALLSTDNHQWYTVDGGSVQYVSRIAADIVKQGGRIRTGTPVQSVGRDAGGVMIRTRGADAERFDRVVFACHSDQALALLQAPTRAEREVLSRIRYQDNRAVLHCDPRQMPRRRRAWASWVYRTGAAGPAPQVGVTYWMNRLQGIDPADPMFVSLNPDSDIPDHMIYDEVTFAHPVFDRAAIAAQAALGDIQGRHGTWYCGAWTRHGFHEDGFASGVTVAENILGERLAA